MRKYFSFFHVDSKVSSNKVVFFIFLNSCWMLGAILITHFLLGNNPKDIIDYYSHVITATAAFGIAYWLEK